jgi:hypothetical protein
MIRNVKVRAALLALAVAGCRVAETPDSAGPSENGTGAWDADGGALAKLTTACTFNSTTKTFAVTLLDGESALISTTKTGSLAVNGDTCTPTAISKSVAKAITLTLKDGDASAADGRGVRVLLDYSGGALVTAGATAPVTVTLGGRPQDEVWVRTSSKPDFVNVTSASVVSVGTSATNTKKDIALTKVGGLSLFLGAGADVVTANSATLPIKAYGGADGDTLSSGAANDILDGGDGDDTFKGGAGDDMLVGGAGDDTLDGGDGCDSYDGGEGVDTNLDDQPAAKVEGVEADFARELNACTSKDITDSIVLKVSFDGDFLDHGPHATPLTNNGVALTTDRNGRNDRSGAFTGDSQIYGNVDSIFGSGQQVTISAWVNPAALPTGNSYPLIAAYGSTGGCGENMSVALEFDGPNGGKAKGAAYKTCLGGDEVFQYVPIGVWSHLTVVFDGAAIRLYINGLFVGISNWTFGDIPSSAAGASIGGGLGGFTGKIDDVMFFDRALDPNEVRALFQME